METFSRSAEKEVASRIAEAAQASASKLQRQIDDVVRAAEAQTTLSNERIQTLHERLERSLELANDGLPSSRRASSSRCPRSSARSSGRCGLPSRASSADRAVTKSASGVNFLAQGSSNRARTPTLRWRRCRLSSRAGRAGEGQRLAAARADRGRLSGRCRRADRRQRRRPPRGGRALEQGCAAVVAEQILL